MGLCQANHMENMGNVNNSPPLKNKQQQFCYCSCEFLKTVNDTVLTFANVKTL